MEKEVRIQFETAKLAKQKGYKISNQYVFDENTGELLPRDPADPGWHDYGIVDGVCASPSQSILQKWLREKHNIDIMVMTTYSFNDCLKEVTTLEVNNNKKREYSFMIFQDHSIDSEEYDTYEKALEVTSNVKNHEV